MTTRLRTPLALLAAFALATAACSDDPVEPEGPASDAEATQQTAVSPAGQVAGDQFVVVLEDGVEPGPAAERIANRFGGQVLHVYRRALNGFALRAADADVQRLSGAPGVDYVEPDQEFQAFGQALPTGVDRIEADRNNTAAIDGSPTGVDGDIAIIDTGIDLDHPDLNVYASTDCTGGGPFNASCTDGEGDDGNGHGTHVAGTAAAIDDSEGVVGMAPGARLWAVKVLSDDGSGWMSDIIAGVDWVTGNAGEIEVANMSLGASDTWSDGLRTAITNSVEAGVVYVVAAGNDSEDIYGGDGSIGDGNETIPAAYPEVAAISALADSDGEAGGNGSDTSYGPDDSFASFSNYSKNVVSNNPVSSSGAAIDLLLPGVDILSTWNDGGTNTISGTSMASPHGAGLALLHIVTNTLSPSSDGDVYDVRQALIDGGVKQNSDDGLTTLDDPDSNEEKIGWAESSGTPSVSWKNPTDGDEVSGDVSIQINASDGEDADDNLDVDWRVDGETWQDATWDLNCGCYTDTWDSITKDDGEHTLDTRATDSDGNAATATITVTVENTDDPPTVSWVNPSDGETVSGTVAIQIDASDDRDSGSDLTVEWQVDDGTWQIATYNSDTGYYEDSWDTSGVSDGDHHLDVRATDTGDNTSSEARITVTVNNDTSGDNSPTIDTFGVSTRTTGPWYRADVQWAVSDADADLSSVTTELLDSSGNVLDDETSSVSGADASGEHNLRTRDVDADSVRLIVTDEAGNETSDTKNISF